jgi:hypothetical protein
MKIKLDKQFLMVMGIAAACSLIVTTFLAFLSLLSWGIVFAALMLLFMPIAHGAIKFYKQKKCSDLEDFFRYLMEDEKEESHISDRIDW